MSSITAAEGKSVTASASIHHADARPAHRDPVPETPAEAVAAKPAEAVAATRLESTSAIRRDSTAAASRESTAAAPRDATAATPRDSTAATPPEPDELDRRVASSLQERRPARATRLPSRRRMDTFVDAAVSLLFSQHGSSPGAADQHLADHVAGLRAELTAMLRSVVPRPRAEEVGGELVALLPAIRERLLADAAAMVEGDPAAESLDEVITAYPGFLAITVHRIAHELNRLRVPLLPRLLTEVAHTRTGVDIHPGASIGRALCIDHGTGIVVGETATIGDDVKLYQGVTLGALSVAKSAAGTKRHPTIQDRVVIYANATVLGGDTVVGHDSVIGGNVWLTTSVPPHSFVYQTSQIRVRSVADALDYSDFSI